jgi:hypothetical protein
MTYLCNVIILLLTQNFIEMQVLIKSVLKDEEEEVVE